MNLSQMALIGYPGVWELAIVLVIVLVIFGPGKLPQIGKALGDSLKSFKKATSDEEIDVTPKAKDGPAQLDEGADHSADASKQTQERNSEA